jgi:cell division cycle 2-like protein
MQSIRSPVDRETSTPSRKRSKWDEEDPEAEAIQKRQQTLKRLIKSSRSTRSSEASPMRVDCSPFQQSHPNLPITHSIFVPPRISHPSIQPSRSVYCYERLNQIEEGSYGVVFRARDKETGDIVALKKLKLDEEKHGFPITALREINALMSCHHENVVRIREVVVGDTLTQ